MRRSGAFEGVCLFIWFVWGTQVDRVWNVMAHAQKPDIVFRRNGRVRLNRQGDVSSSGLLAAEVYASAVVMLDTPCSEVVWRVLATHSIRQFPPLLSLPCVTVCHHISTGAYRMFPFSPWRRKAEWYKQNCVTGHYGQNLATQQT
jgi:hypothetical protein